jgi:uncharacterized protein (DUF305 family)
MDRNTVTRLMAPVALVSVVACAGGARELPPPAAPPPVVQAGAPGEASRTIAAGELGRVSRPRHVQADIDFMRDMIVHHVQAVEMTALVRERTESHDIRLLAERIEASQDDELRMMRRWLTERGAPLPDEHAHHMPQVHVDMPGMLSAEEMSALRAARGAGFDRLFLEGMIKHHEGALVMVAKLFATDGAGQETEMFQFASHVDSDQRMEIMRMQRMLAERR